MRQAVRLNGTATSFWWRWAPLILWMAVITSLSTDAFSAQETSRLLLPVLRWLLPNASPPALDLLHGIVRKGAHVTEFAILALLWYRALDWHRSGWQSKIAVTAFVLAAAFGALDEMHQIFVPSRTASVADLGWDSLGAILGLFMRHVVRL